jgi:hypothetical protein
VNPAYTMPAYGGYAGFPTAPGVAYPGPPAVPRPTMPESEGTLPSEDSYGHDRRGRARIADPRNPEDLSKWIKMAKSISL